MNNNFFISKSAKIYVAGHTGLVGSALVRKLVTDGYTNILTLPIEQLDLTRQSAVESFFTKEQPEYVFLAAAKVGGIYANSIYPANFINDNLAIQQNIINASYQNNVKRLLFLGSSCIYPRDCLQPIKEEYLLTGTLEPTNRPYAIAKIAGIEQCWAYNRQHQTNYLAVMPTNLYGPNDNYDQQNSHVLPALIRKFHEAKISNKPTVTVWGTGKPKREFLYVDDLADACLYLMNLSIESYKNLLNNDHPPLINIGYGDDISIYDLAMAIKAVTEFNGNIEWDHNKPDGTPRKLLCCDKIFNLGWKAKTNLIEGIIKTYQYYLHNITNN